MSLFKPVDQLDDIVKLVKLVSLILVDQRGAVQLILLIQILMQRINKTLMQLSLSENVAY